MGFLLKLRKKDADNKNVSKTEDKKREGRVNEVECKERKHRKKNWVYQRNN